MPDEPPSLDLGERIEREERERAARLTRVIIPVLAGAMLLEASLAYLTPDPNVPLLVLLFGPTFALLAAAYLLHRSGYPRAAAWVVTTQIWALTWGASLGLGGLSNEIGSGLVAVVILAAATLGSRGAVVFCVLGFLAVSFVTFCSVQGLLPPPVVPVTPWVSWIALTVSLVLGTALTRLIIRGLRAAMLRTLIASSERDAARIRYLQAQKMEPVGRLASGVAHDFNNLLTVMTGVSSLLRQGERDPKLVQGLLDDLDSATARATLMTGQLLAFTRNRPEDARSLDISELVRDMIPLLARLLGDDVRVELSVEAEGVRVRADRSQFEQIILNLAVNARDAMPEGGLLKLTVGVDTPRTRALVTVTDTGIGMEASLVDKIFTPFFTTKRTGTGLGLATVRDIVTEYGGELTLESRVGQGTRFRLGFPLLPGTESQRPTPVIPPPDIRPGRLLLVEDHDLVRRTNRRALEQAGFEVTAVIDGVEALSLIDGGGRFDIIITDMMMPRMSGAELALELSARANQTPVLFVSGNFDHAPEGLQALPFASKFLGKPFALATLLAAVSELMAAARVESQAHRDEVG